jgi:hypothetical protein
MEQYFDPYLQGLFRNYKFIFARYFNQKCIADYSIGVHHGYISNNMDYCALMSSSYADVNSDFTFPTIMIYCII